MRETRPTFSGQLLREPWKATDRYLLARNDFIYNPRVTDLQAS